jgi:release factor glutamine methyltransferase
LAARMNRPYNSRLPRMMQPSTTSFADTWTVRRLLEWTSGFFTRKNVDPARLSAELLLAHVLNVPRIKLYTDYERPLNDKELASFRALVQRASEQEPIAYLTGKAHFFNLEFEVNPDVLIPRPDTETIVENVLQLKRYEAGFETPRVLDLCTGSGCIAAAIAHHLKQSTVLATDISAHAIVVAKRNIERLHVDDRVTIELGDLYEPISRIVDAQPFDLIVSNPPYIPTAQLEQLDRSVKDYEPRVALDGGLDGLQLVRRILAGAPNHLRAGARIYLEIQFNQGSAVLELAKEHESWLTDARIIKDQAGRDRVLTGRKK